MTEKPVDLESLTKEGRELLQSREPTRDHRDFMYWLEDVSKWLDEQFPGSGLSAQWSGLAMSVLVVGNHYDNSHEARVHFNRVVAARLQWLGELGKSIQKSRAPVNAGTNESDALFSAIDGLIKGSVLPQQFKPVVCSDLAEAQRSYRAQAYKACVVMLGAALEGVEKGSRRKGVRTILIDWQRRFG